MSQRDSPVPSASNTAPPGADELGELVDRVREVRGRALDVFASIERDVERARDGALGAEPRRSELRDRLDELADEGSLPFGWRDLIEHMPLVGDRSTSPRVLEQFLRSRYEEIGGFHRRLEARLETLTGLRGELEDLSASARDLERSALGAVTDARGELADCAADAPLPEGSNGEREGVDGARWIGLAVDLERAAISRGAAGRIVRAQSAVERFVSEVRGAIAPFTEDLKSSLDRLAEAFDESGRMDAPEAVLEILAEGAETLGRIHAAIEEMAAEIEVLARERAMPIYDRIDAVGGAADEAIDRLEAMDVVADETRPAEAVASAVETASALDLPDVGEGDALDELRGRLRTVESDTEYS